MSRRHKDHLHLSRLRRWFHELCTLPAHEFLRRFLQHVLPTGFQRVRHFGWLSPAARKRWGRIHALLDWKPAASPEASAAPSWAPCCPRCQKPMRLLGTFARSPPWIK